MYHFDIPKTRQYDTGKIEVIARSSAGEAVASTELKVIPRHDDYRGVLKNAPRRKFYIHLGKNMTLMLQLTVSINIKLFKKYIHIKNSLYTALTYITIPRTLQQTAYAQKVPPSFPLPSLSLSKRSAAKSIASASFVNGFWERYVLKMF